MDREEHDRLRMLGQVQKPAAPQFGAPKNHFNHHAVHLAACWLHILTDAKVKHHLDDFEAYRRAGTHMSPDELDVVARDLLQELHGQTSFFTPEVYSSIYGHIAQGFSKS
jgi:hypothetical protein